MQRPADVQREWRRWLVAGALLLAAGGLAVAARNLLAPSCVLPWRERWRIDARSLQAAGEVYRSEHAACPTLGDLVNVELVLPTQHWHDRWGSVAIICTSDRVWIEAAGPDKLRHTADDLDWR